MMFPGVQVGGREVKTGRWGVWGLPLLWSKSIDEQQGWDTARVGDHGAERAGFGFEESGAALGEQVQATP